MFYTHAMQLTANVLLEAYRQGMFPMAEDADATELYWFSPEERGIIPLDGFNIPRGLKKTLRENPFEIRVNSAFEAVMRACAEPVPGTDREVTWINEEIIALYCELHAQGHAHSVESWYEGKLAGGLYGVSLGGAFFGESMFSYYSEASKVPLVYLVALLKQCGYTLLDTQYVNDHLKQFGCVSIPRVSYMSYLEKALSASPSPSTRFCTTAELSDAESLLNAMLTSPAS